MLMETPLYQRLNLPLYRNDRIAAKNEDSMSGVRDEGTELYAIECSGRAFAAIRGIMTYCATAQRVRLEVTIEPHTLYKGWQRNQCISASLSFTKSYS